MSGRACGEQFLVETPGFCLRRETCSVAASGTLVRVPLEKPFLCPECGAKLTPPALADIKPLARRPVLLASAVGVLCLLVVGVVLARGGFQRAHAPPPAPVEQQSTLSLAPVPLAQPAPDIIVETLDSPPAATFPATEAATPASSVLRPRSEVPAPRHASRANHARANVRLSFSIPLVAGGEPDYPDQYQDGQSGTVTVSCGLRPDGGTQDCKTIRRSGGPIFDVAVHSWLDLRDVRFKPARLRGRLVNRVTLTVDFIGAPPPP